MKKRYKISFRSTFEPGCTHGENRIIGAKSEEQAIRSFCGSGDYRYLKLINVDGKWSLLSRDGSEYGIVFAKEIEK